MSAQMFNQKKINDIRMPLHKVLPLSVPYSIVFSLASICNFRCFYCIQKNQQLIPEAMRKMKYMPYELFKQCVDNILKTGHLKKVNLSGTGEPLLNPDLVPIVDYAMKSGMADEVELITNASLLTHEVSDGLISTQLDKLKISIQGMNSASYMDIASVKIDFDQLVQNIGYFYKHKEKTKIRIKIVDSMVSDPEKLEQFHQIFEPICDEMVIENIKPIYSKVDYSRLSVDTRSKNFYNEQLLCNQICTRPFFNVNIWTDGSVGQCSNVETLEDIQFGNAAEDFDGIWNGKRYNEFLLSLLHKNNFSQYATCGRCKEYQCMALPSDILDGHEEELIQRYEEKLAAIEEKSNK